MYILYDFIFLIFTILYLPYLVLTRRYHSRLRERLGVFDRAFFNAMNNKEVVWLHAVSVGEVMAASPFIKEFHVHFPNHKLLISTVTETGNNIASRIKREEDLLIYFPLDLSFIIQRILKRIKVKLFIIMETELWPNIITVFYKKAIPIALLNGRLSTQSFRAYKAIKILLKGVLEKISLFCMQTTADASRLKSLGVNVSKIKVTGNMKYDATGIPLKENPGQLRASLGIGSDEKILIAGSTHPGEEEIIIYSYKKLLRQFPKLRLLIAPRHITRTEEIEKIIRKNGLASKRFSSINKDSSDIKVVILDVMGKLCSLYAISDIVFMGGSLFARYGGHNLLEPAAFKKTILFGPHMTNFKSMADEFLKKGAAIEVKNTKEIEKECKELLNSPSKREAVGKVAFDIIENNRGAAQRNINYIESILLRGVIDR